MTALDSSFIVGVSGQACRQMAEKPAIEFPRKAQINERTTQEI
jgi:hypothetical protein